MDNNQQKPDQGNFGTWIILIGLLLVAYRLESKVVKLWSELVRNQTLIRNLKIFGVVLLLWGLWELRAWFKRNKKLRVQEKAILGNGNDAVFCGTSDKGERVFIKTAQRSMHTQVIGTTNAGKTESVILPWAIQDIAQGRGLILIDGKADRSLLDKLYAYTVKCGREGDFKLFSLSHLDESTPFNPLLGGTPEEVSERVFNSFEFENAYYRSVQYEIFTQILRAIHLSKQPASFSLVYQLLKEPAKLLVMAENTKDEMLISWATEFASFDRKERREQISGLTSAISQFVLGEHGKLFNATQGIDLNEALAKNQIIYFQLPVMMSPFLGKATGKLILQCFQSAIAQRHRRGGSMDFYSCFLDDFTEYLYPGFVSILNKSRSANVGIVFAHQALGDIKTLGDAVANSILTNANLKIFMRGNDPESAEYFARVLGTRQTVKLTEREKKGFWSQDKTGDVSSREVEEFNVHPNIFKSKLGVGAAMMLVPHMGGSKTIKVQFEKLDDLPPVMLPKVILDSEGTLLPIKNEKPKDEFFKQNEENV